MEKSINIAIVLVLTLIGSLALLNYVNSTFQNEQNKTFEIKEIKETKDGNNLTISWLTDKVTNGEVKYMDSCNLNYKNKRRNIFEKSNEILLENICPGSFKYSIEICDLIGNCKKIEEKTITV